MDVTIVVATYGSDQWRELGAATAAAHDAVHVHGDTLAVARNRAARDASTEWLVHLDADDELAPGYVDAIAESYGDLRAPVLELRYPNRVERPDLAGRDIERMNPCCIGTAIRRDTLLALGGWPDFPAWEDWALFLRAARRGATVTHVPHAVYRATVRPDGRNQTVAEPAALFRAIRQWA